MEEELSFSSSSSAVALSIDSLFTGLLLLLLLFSSELRAPEKPFCTGALCCRFLRFLLFSPMSTSSPRSSSVSGGNCGIISVKVSLVKTCFFANAHSRAASLYWAPEER